MQESLDQILVLVNRKIPYHLEELRLECLKMSPGITL